MGSPSFHLAKGDLLNVQGQHFTIESKDSAGMVLRQFRGKMIARHYGNDELRRLYFDGELSIVRNVMPSLPRNVTDNIGRQLDSFRPHLREAALVRLDYVILCDRYFANRKAPKTPAGFSRIAKVGAWLRRRREAQALGRPARSCALEAFGGSTLRNWYWRWFKSGRSLAALVPLDDRKGRYGPRHDPAIIDVAASTLRERWLTLEAPPLTLVQEVIEDNVNVFNERNGTDFSPPSISTVRRYIEANISDFDIMAKREGKAAAEQKYRYVRRAPRASRPMQVVEFDHTKLDVMIVLPGDDGERKTKRAWLSVGICSATRMIVGYHISFEHPSWASVMAVLRMAVLPKDALLEDLRSPWPVFGVPEVVVVDNGKEFHSNSLKAAAGHLGFELRYTPKRKPHLKGKVERFFGEVAGNFAAVVPGRTFNSVAQRGDYPSEKLARMTLEEVDALFRIWLVDYYHNRPHSGLLGRTPLDAWEDLADAYSVRLPPHVDDLQALIGLVIDRTVTPSGVANMGLDFQSAQLQAMHRRPGHLGKLCMVKVDPGDLSQVLVLDDAEGRWIRVPSADPALTDRLTVGMWKEITDAGKASTDRGRKVTRQVLLDARARILSRVGEGTQGPAARIPVVDDWMRNVDEKDFAIVEPASRQKKPDLQAQRRSRKRADAAAPPVTQAKAHSTVDPAMNAVTTETLPPAAVAREIAQPARAEAVPPAELDPDDPDNWS